MSDSRRLDDDIVQEKEENKREPGGCLFGVDICSRVLCGTGMNLELSHGQISQDKPWNRTEHIELERRMEQLQQQMSEQ